MSIWEKISLGVRFLFGGFESAIDYALELLNKFLAKDGVATKVQKARSLVSAVLAKMQKYEGYCPAKWMEAYLKTLAAVGSLNAALADGAVTTAELNKAVEAVKEAIAEWQKD